MPQSSTTISPLTTFLLLFACLLAFFPALFHTVIWAPYNFVFPDNTPRNPTTVHCTEPHICVSPKDLNTMSWFQKTITLPSKSRGSYLITDDIVTALPEIKSYKVGLLHLFIQHTSCALSLNENWDSDVRADMSDALDRIVPEDKGVRGDGRGLYRHDAEGSDDMPAHVKSALVGASVSIPITNGRLATGTWQGIWYLEFRDARHTRKVVATIQGEKM